MPAVELFLRERIYYQRGSDPSSPPPTSELNMDMSGMNWVYVNMIMAVIESTVGGQSP